MSATLHIGNYGSHGVEESTAAAAGVRLQACRLPEAATATAIAALIGLSAANPDRFIAEQNVDPATALRPRVLRRRAPANP